MSKKIKFLLFFFQIYPMLKMLNYRFPRAYRPGRRLSYDEAGVAYRGKVFFLHYNKDKPDKYSMMLYVCAEAGGYTLGIDPYFGEQTKEQYKAVPLQRVRITTDARAATARANTAYIARAKKKAMVILRRGQKEDTARAKKKVVEIPGKKLSREQLQQNRPIKKPSKPPRADRKAVRVSKKVRRNPSTNTSEPSKPATLETVNTISRQVFGHLDNIGLLDRGHFIFMDNLYTSPELFQLLLSRKTYACGTVRPQRTGWPIALGKKPSRTPRTRGKVPNPLKGLEKLERGDTKVRRNGAMLALQFQDKKEVNMLSTIHTAKLVHLLLDKGKRDNNVKRRAKQAEYKKMMDEKKELAKKKRKSEEEKKRLKDLRSKTEKKPKHPTTDIKPLAIYDYNFDMGGPDHLGQLIDSYDFLRPSLKWTTKFTLWMFSCAVVNAYILHRKFGTEKDMDHMQFRRQIVHHLVRDSNFHLVRDKPATFDRLSAGSHFPRRNSPTHTRKAGQLDCVACNPLKQEKEKLGMGFRRKRTQYQCRQCKVSLCIEPCFEIYHTQVDYRRIAVDQRQRLETPPAPSAAQDTPVSVTSNTGAPSPQKQE